MMERKHCLLAWALCVKRKAIMVSSVIEMREMGKRGCLVTDYQGDLLHDDNSVPGGPRMGYSVQA